MYLHKTAANAPSGKPAPEQSIKNAASKTPQAQTAKTSASALPPVPRSVSSMVSAAGLPADKLSASIVSFARFFSLPIKPELMAAIRRQTLAASLPGTQALTGTQAIPGTQTRSAAAVYQSDLAKRTAAESASNPETAVKSREALSLAAAAAESKGVELNPKGLEMFAEAIDPDRGRQDSRGQDQHGRRNKDHDESEEEGATFKTGSLSASGVEKLALESAGKAPLLDVLNRMPGKDGRRWIVLPFSFNQNGRDFRASMRILLEPEGASSRAACMAFDIAETVRTQSVKSVDPPPSEKRWLFALEAANGRISRLSVYLQPELPSSARQPLAGELSGLLGIPEERVTVKEWTETFPCETGGADQPRAIDEAV